MSRGSGRATETMLAKETRRNEVKGKPEFTEAAEATEDRRGAEEIYRRLNFFIL